VEGWSWLEKFGVDDFYSEVGVFLKQHHREQLVAKRVFRG
jgi:hypothetical protein